MEIFVTTCDKYSGVLRVFFHLYEHFWGDPLTVVGYTKPSFLPDYATFHSMGTDKGVKKWSNDLIRYFSSIDVEKYIWMMEDTFLYNPINKEAIQILWDIMGDENIIRADCSPMMWILLDNRNQVGKTLIKYTDQYKYPIYKTTHKKKASMPVSIWNRKNFLDLIKPGQDPWQFERASDMIGQSSSKISICFDKKDCIPIPFIEGHLTAEEGYAILKNSLGEVPDKLVTEMLELGYIKGQGKKIQELTRRAYGYEIPGFR